MDSPSSPPLQQSHNPSQDADHRPMYASHLKHPFSSPRSSGMLARTSSSVAAPAHLKSRRSSSSSSSSPPSPSSSSSSDSLAPRLFDFKRSRQHRQQPRSPGLFPLPRTPRTLGELIDDPRLLPTQIVPSLTEAHRFYPRQMPFLGGSADPPLSITSQESNSIISAQPQDPGGMHCEDVVKNGDVDKEGNRKLLIWRAACAMAHAYLHQHDYHPRELHQHDLHRHELHQHGLGDPTQQLDVGTTDKDGLHLHDDFRNVQLSASAKSAPPLPPPAPIKSSRDEMYTSSMCSSNDVVCIDEVVNPTQAAEWFGALFLSTSALVS